MIVKTSFPSKYVHDAEEIMRAVGAKVAMGLVRDKVDVVGKDGDIITGRYWISSE